MKSKVTTLALTLFFALAFFTFSIFSFQFPDTKNISTQAAFNIPYHHTQLNPALWTKTSSLKATVAKQLKLIYNYYKQFYHLDLLAIKGVYFVGSNASYDYDRYSDIDIHVIYDPKNCTPCTTLLNNSLRYINYDWAQNHNVLLNRYPVNFYLQPFSTFNKEKKTSGVYSLTKQSWIYKPKLIQTPKIDFEKVKETVFSVNKKVKQIASLYPKHEYSLAVIKAKKLKTQLTTGRNKALATEGRMSVANISYKVLRRTGVLTDLRLYERAAMEKSLSLETK